METQTKKLLTFFLLPLALLTAVVWIAQFETQPDWRLHVNFYDVGQGDSIFIQTYLGRQIVVDGGPSDLVLERLGADLPFFDRSIDMLILTHPHADHVIGLVDILRRYQVKKVLLPDVKFNSSAYQEFLDLIEKKHIEKIFAQAGQRVWLDNSTVLDIYYPGPGQIDQSAGKEGFGVASLQVNDTSIVAKLSFGRSHILFTGDAGVDIEHQLMTEFNLQSDILKVGHHGSSFSSSKEFLEEVRPAYAVIEVGQNNYGHPTAVTLDNLAAVGARIFRTDTDHTVRFTSDGTELYKN